MTIIRKNLYFAQKLQKRYHNKAIKFRSSTLNDRVWLNSQYIQTKYNNKLKPKFFRLRVLQSMGKQAYNLKLAKK